MHLPPIDSRPRILHVTQPVDGGVARVVTDLTRAQLAAGLSVVVACPDGSLAVGLRSLGAEVRHWPATRSPGAALAAEVRRLVRVIADVRPDLVHAHSAKAGLAARLAVRGRVPTVFQPHAWSFEAVGGPTSALALGWERWGARWAARTVCVSEAERLRGVRAGVRGRWTVIPNGIDLDRFHAGAVDGVNGVNGVNGMDGSGGNGLRGADGAEDADGVRGMDGARGGKDMDGLSGPHGPHGPLVVCVGRLCRQKGQDVLLTAWRSVLARVPGARLALVGDGPDHARLAEHASAYGFLGPVPAAPTRRPGGPGPVPGPHSHTVPGERTSVSVRFTGAVADVMPWYRAADLVVLPSRWEGMALAPLEALACGRPVVVTDVDGAREGLPPALVPHCLVPPEDPEALADAVAGLLLDAPLRASLGRRGRAHVLSTHDVRHTAAAIAAVYDELLGDGRTTGPRSGADEGPATAVTHRRHARPPAAPHRLPGERPAVVGRPAVVPIEYRESTHP